VRSGKHLTKADMKQWHAILNQRGWLANGLARRSTAAPGWNAVQKFIFDNECALAHAPRIVPFGVNMLGPVLIKYGSEAQKQLLAAAHPRRLRTGGARATPSPAPAPTWRR
jgi:hypothetical protein